MNARVALSLAAVLSLGVAPSPPAQTIVREDGRLRIPVGPPSAGAPPVLECLAAVGPAIPVTALAFSPDGKLLASAAGRDVVLWDLDAAKLWKRAGAGQADATVHALAFSKDGRWLAVGEGKPCVSGAVRLVDVQSDQTVVAFQEPKDVVYGLAFNPDGNLLAAGSADGKAYVWNVPDKKLVVAIHEHTDWVLGVAFSPDGKLLATASTDRSVRVWEVGTWKSLNRLLQGDPVQAVAFSPDGQLLSWAVAGPQNRVVRWRQPLDPPEETNTPAAARKPKVIPQIRNIDTSGGTPLALVWGSVPQGNPLQPRMLAACADKTVKVYDINGSQRATLAGHGDWIYAAAVSSDGKTFASGSGDGTVRLWQGVENRPLATLVQLSPGKNDWLIVAAPGYFATSSPGAVSWDKKSLNTGPEKLAELLGKPELVRDALAGKPLAAPPLK
jgi:WD40 repeat protein